MATLEQADGEAANLAKTMSDNALGDFTTMTSGLDALRTSIYETNSGAIRNFIKSVTSMVQKTTAWAKENPELVATLGKIFGILAIGAVILGTVGAVMLTILGPMALLRASLATLGLPSTLMPFTMLVNAIKLVGSAFKVVAGALMAYTPLAAYLLGTATI